MATALFVCLHNAGRSQMSAALFERAAGGRHHALSGSETTQAEHVHPKVIEVMREPGFELDLADRTPSYSHANSPSRPTSSSQWAAETNARTSQASATWTGTWPTRRTGRCQRSESPGMRSLSASRP